MSKTRPDLKELETLAYKTLGERNYTILLDNAFRHAQIEANHLGISYKRTEFGVLCGQRREQYLRGWLQQSTAYDNPKIDLKIKRIPDSEYEERMIRTYG